MHQPPGEDHDALSEFQIFTLFAKRLYFSPKMLSIVNRHRP
jgi:hypothetical protein